MLNIPNHIISYTLTSEKAHLSRYMKARSWFKYMGTLPSIRLWTVR